MDSIRHERLREALHTAAAEFIASEAGPQSLITVTRVELSEDCRRARFFVSVLPESAQESALAFINRQKRGFGPYFERRVRGARTPSLSFVPDIGLRNLERVEEISHELEGKQ